MIYRKGKGKGKTYKPHACTVGGVCSSQPRMRRRAACAFSMQRRASAPAHCVTGPALFHRRCPTRGSCAQRQVHSYYCISKCEPIPGDHFSLCSFLFCVIFFLSGKLCYTINWFPIIPIFNNKRQLSCDDKTWHLRFLMSKEWKNPDVLWLL